MIKNILIFFLTLLRVLGALIKDYIGFWVRHTCFTMLLKYLAF